VHELGKAGDDYCQFSCSLIVPVFMNVHTSPWWGASNQPYGTAVHRPPLAARVGPVASGGKGYSTVRITAFSGYELFDPPRADSHPHD
jgi:hypothetical protein